MILSTRNKTSLFFLMKALLFHSTIDDERFPVYSTSCLDSYYIAITMNI